MQLHQLIYFVTVSKTLNFTKAAEQLYVSQSSLSTQIANLEEELGCQLCIRTTRSVQLTAAGRYLAEWAQDVLLQIDHLPDELSRVQKGQLGKVRVGYSAGSQRFIVHAMKRIHKAYPELQVVPELAKDIAQMLRMENSRVDAILLPKPCIRGMDWVASDVVAPSGLSLLVSEDHPLAGSTEVSIYRLALEKLILFPRPQIPRLYDTLISELHTRGIVPQAYLTAVDSASIIPMVKAGLGVQLVSDYTTKEQGEGVWSIPVRECREGYDLLFVYDSKTCNPCIPLLRSALMNSSDQNEA